MKMKREVELNILHQVLIFAKFGDKDKRLELSGSPLVVELLKSVRKELGIHDESLKMDNYPDCIDYIRERIIELRNYNLSDDKLNSTINDMVYPFEISDKLKNHFIMLYKQKPR